MSLPEIVARLRTETLVAASRAVQGEVDPTASLLDAVASYLSAVSTAPKDDIPALHSQYFALAQHKWEDLWFESRWEAAARIWTPLIEAALVWGRQNKAMVHLGTPLYFRGGTHLRAGRIDEGFQDIHAALAEDRKNLRPGHPAGPQPAFRFVSLDDHAAQYWGPLVQQARADLEQRITTFNTSAAKPLTLDAFRSRFLANPDHWHASCLFVYALFSAFHRGADRSPIDQSSQFDPILQSRRMLNFYVVAETLLNSMLSTPLATTPVQPTTKPKSSTSKPKPPALSSLVDSFYKRHLKGTPTARGKAFLEKMKTAFEKDRSIIPSILGGTFKGTTISREDAILVLCAPIRNALAHSSDPPSIVTSHSELCWQAALDTVFLIVSELPMPALPPSS